MIEEVVKILQSPLAQSGLTASLHFILALALVELKQPERATEHLHDCLAKRNEPALTPINPDVHKAGPHHALAICFAQMKQNAAADEAFRAGLDADPRSRPLRLDYARFLAQQRRVLDSLHILHQLVSEDASDAEAWQFGGQIALSQPEFLAFAQDWTSEAIRSLPGNPAIAAQRNEVLSRGPKAVELCG